MKAILLIMIGYSVLLFGEFSRENSIVTQVESGLMWQDNRAAKETRRDWNGAKSYCQNLNLSGYSDWYLPSMKELLTITDKDRYNPSIITEFNNITPDDYWSSSEDQSYSDNAWRVDFKYGDSLYYNKSNIYYVRCVRAGQSVTLTFDKLVQNLIDQKLGDIQKPDLEVKLVKDMFETQGEFEARVAKTKTAQKKEIAAFKKELGRQKRRARNEAIKEALEITYGKPQLNDLNYDAENGYFVADLRFEAKKEFKQKVALKVPRNEARAFYEAKESLNAEAVFDYDGKSVTLKRIEVPFKTKHYLAQFTDRSISDTSVAVNLSNDLDLDMSLASSVSIGHSDVTRFDASGLKSFNDLDKLLASAKAVKSSNKKWLFAIGIEQYEYTDNIAFAARSAKMFVKTAQKVLGVPKQNSYVMLNAKASQARIKTNLKKMLRRVSAGDTIYFYYNGHGIPVPSQKNKPYLLAYDSEADFIQDESFFSLQNIYSKLSDSEASKIVAVVDSCFSGVTDGKAVLKGVAATRVVPKRTSFNQEKMVVLSAGKGHQYSNAYTKKGHRLFSFFVMKNMLEGDKEIKTLYKDVKAQTYETSFKEYGDLRVQEPTIEGNARMRL